MEGEEGEEEQQERAGQAEAARTRERWSDPGEPNPHPDHPPETAKTEHHRDVTGSTRSRRPERWGPGEEGEGAVPPSPLLARRGPAKTGARRRACRGRGRGRSSRTEPVGRRGRSAASRAGWGPGGSQACARTRRPQAGVRTSRALPVCRAGAGAGTAGPPSLRSSLAPPRSQSLTHRPAG